MRRALSWLAGLAVVAAVVRLLTRRSKEPASVQPAAPAGEGDPAAELRRKLDESRARESEPTENGEAVDTDVAEPALTIEERRARVHAKAQQAIESMRGPDA